MWQLIPLEYCIPGFQDIHSHPYYLGQDEQCHYNRTGILCGSCPKGWSVVLGSSECHECSSVWLLLILPFALAGVLLVVVIHFLNLTVTMGTVSGLQCSVAIQVAIILYQGPLHSFKSSSLGSTLTLASQPVSMMAWKLLEKNCFPYLRLTDIFHIFYQIN